MLLALRPLRVDIVKKKPGKTYRYLLRCLSWALALQKKRRDACEVARESCGHVLQSLGPGCCDLPFFLHRHDVGHRDLGHARGDYGKGDRVRLLWLFFDPSWCTSETYDQAYELAYDDRS